MSFSKFLFSILLVCISTSLTAQLKILFDASKGESASNADWVIDTDLHNLNWGASGAYTCTSSSCNEANAQRIPTPAQPAAGVTTAETYWDGALSYWGIDCAYKGYKVETLPAISGKITYGNSSNAQDLSNYKTFVVCEPNTQFTAAEKTAILSFVSNGGSLFMISDHDVSDRNGDGWDSPHIWNDLMQVNSTGNTNPFGMIFDYANLSETSTKVAALLTDSILHGPLGAVAKVKWSGGTTITISPTVNPSVKGIIYKNSVTSASGNLNVYAAYARYGRGKVVAIGDSSPCDDGTGDPNDGLFYGYTGDAPPNHRNLLMNATIWLMNVDKNIYTFTGSGNWSVAGNWLGSKVPPTTLPSGDEIIINPPTNGTCILDVTQHISSGATITVSTGKNFLIPGVLTIQ